MHFHIFVKIFLNYNIKFIYHRFALLRSFIQQCREQSAAAEQLFSDTIITLEIKRIKAVFAREKKLNEC